MMDFAAYMWHTYDDLETEEDYDVETLEDLVDRQVITVHRVGIYEDLCSIASNPFRWSPGFAYNPMGVSIYTVDL
jgi:hypothetical protein